VGVRGHEACIGPDGYYGSGTQTDVIADYRRSGKFWVRWGDALREAGFEPNQFNPAFDDTMIIEKFVSLMRELGKFPVRRELKLKRQTDKSFSSAGVFERLGSKPTDRRKGSRLLQKPRRL
jgi:hypothetical protein